MSDVVCPFHSQLLRLVGRLGSCKAFNHTSWMTVVTPTDSTWSVCNRCVIEVSGGVFVLCLDFFLVAGGGGLFQ